MIMKPQPTFYIKGNRWNLYQRIFLLGWVSLVIDSFQLAYYISFLWVIEGLIKLPEALVIFSHLMNPPFFVGLPTLLTLFWLLVLWWAWMWVLGTKSSSMSRTLANRDLEDFSLRSSSFILFCIMMVFLVIFSPGLAILRTQGIHWRNNVLTYKIYKGWSIKQNIKKFIFHNLCLKFADVEL